MTAFGVRTRESADSREARAPAQPTPTPAASADVASALVRGCDLFKIYREGSTETVALRGANLELPAGSITSLMGRSGSGKSTLVMLLAGLALPTAGQVLVDGVDITRLDENERARLRTRQVGIVFQRDNLFLFLSASDNVALAITLAGGRRANRRAKELLAELGLGARVRHFPRQLSGGEAQRVAIAVALANEPRILLGDELTGELDSRTASSVLEVITRQWEQRGLTVLMVTHNPLVASIAQRRLRIVDGIVQKA
jgi:putative ABC transport system ATP-binding protein